MVVGLAAALGAAVAFGVAALLQAVAARREERTRGVTPRLLLRLLRHPEFVVALGLTLGGFLLHLVALRSLPLFLAQAVIASSVAVTALLSARFLGTVLTGAERVAVAAVCVGLALLTGAASHPASSGGGAGIAAALLGATAAVTAAGTLAGRVPGPRGASLLGLVAGLGFAVVAVAARVLPGLTPAEILAEPATYALLASGAVAFLLYATALQRGTVMTATSAMVVGQTVAPAAVGVLALGDRVRPGWAPLAALGLCLAVAGAVTLVRRDPHAAADPPDEAGVEPPRGRPAPATWRGRRARAGRRWAAAGGTSSRPGHFRRSRR